MNRPIKFRGRVCDENKAQSDQGKTVYGNCLFQYPNGTVALSHTIKLALTFVEPESVAQLVGFDANGNEVYEGDELISVDGDYEDTAKLFSNVCDSDKLKEATNETHNPSTRT